MSLEAIYEYQCHCLFSNFRRRQRQLQLIKWSIERILMGPTVADGTWAGRQLTFPAMQASTRSVPAVTNSGRDMQSVLAQRNAGPSLTVTRNAGQRPGYTPFINFALTVRRRTQDRQETTGRTLQTDVSRADDFPLPPAKSSGNRWSGAQSQQGVKLTLAGSSQQWQIAPTGEA